MYSLKDRRIEAAWFKLSRLYTALLFKIASDHNRHATRQAVFIPEEDATPIPTYGLLKGPSRLELRANFFSQRVINTWNALPLHTKNSLSGASQEAVELVYVIRETLTFAHQVYFGSISCIKIAGPPSFLFRYLERLARSLVYFI